MREKNKLAYLKDYRKAKEVTDTLTNDLEFLDKIDGKFDPFQLAVEEGNVDEAAAAEPTKRARKHWCLSKATVKQTRLSFYLIKNATFY